MEEESLKTRHAGSPVRNGRQRYQGYIRHKMLALAGISAITFSLIIASLMAGSSDMGIREVLSGLFMTGDEHARIVVWNLRMPRILTALVGGAALALAGCAFQSVLRNPLASASTLGISQGAAFGASIAIVVIGGGAAMHEGVSFGNPYITIICAFAGALSSTIVILALSRFRDMTPESIVLAGVAISAVFTGGTALVQYFAEDTQVAAVVFWTFGDLGRVTYRELAIIAIVTAAAAVFFLLNRWNLNAMESGEGSAHGLGVNVSSVRLASMFTGSAAASTVIAFCGTINFIGLAAPHITRRLIGSDYRHLLPGSAIMGAGLLLASDLIARSALAPVILPISAITSFVGAPIFLYLLMKGSRR